MLGICKIRRDVMQLAGLSWLQGGQEFDVGILDMQMPEMDGVELALAIRETHDKRSLPLILLSSLGQLGHDEWEVEQADFSALLSKPVKPSPILNALMELFPLSQSNSFTVEQIGLRSTDRWAHVFL